MKIIYMLLDSYGSRTVQKYHKKATEEGKKIEFWCLGNLYYDDFMYDENTDRGNEVKSVFIKNWLHLIKLLLKEPRGNRYLLDGLGGLGRRTYLLHIFLKISGGKVYWLGFGNGTGHMEALEHLPQKSIWDFIKPDVCFFSHRGYAGSLPSKKALNTWNIQYLGSDNWNRYLQVENKIDESLINTKYAVFCDENLCYHIEAELQGICWVEDKEQYYEDCNQLFKRIKEELEIDVVVALHPSFVHNKKDNKWISEYQIAGKTIELIKNAEFVILYTCTSIDYAVLCNKPVMYYTSCDLERCNQNLNKGSFSKNYIKNLDAKYLFIDSLNKCENLRNYICYNENLYKKYKKEFIVPSENIKRGCIDEMFDWLDKN